MIFAYTLINTFHDVCPWQAYQRWWLKLKVPTTPEMQKGFDDHSALEKRLKFGHALPPHLDVCEPTCEALMARGIPITETKMGVTRSLESTGFWDNDCYLRSVADVKLYNDGNTSVFIGDWKTGKKREDGEPLQLMILAGSAFAYYPTLQTVAAANIYTSDGKTGKVHTWRRSQLPEIWRTIVPMIQEIEQAEKDNNFPKRKGPLCGWCPVFSCEHNRNPQKGT